MVFVFYTKKAKQYSISRYYLSYWCIVIKFLFLKIMFPTTVDDENVCTLIAILRTT